MFEQFEMPLTAQNSRLLNSPSLELIDQIVTTEKRIDNALSAWGCDTLEELDQLMTDWLK